MSLEYSSERLIIRPYHQADFDHCLKLYSDPNLITYFDHGKPRTKQEVISLIKERAQPYTNIPLGLFSVFLKHAHQFLGQIDLIPSQNQLEIGFIFHASHQGKGYAHEATDYLLTHHLPNILHQYPHLIELTATVHPNNIPSQKLLTKLGLQYQSHLTRFGNPRLWFSKETGNYKNKEVM